MTPALLAELAGLTEHHRRACPEYARMLAAVGHPPGRRYREPAELPWLPVGVFKRQTLRSVPEADVFRVLTSSGTTGVPSRVPVDRSDAARQQAALVATLRPVLGGRRLPMLLADSRTTLTAAGGVSARHAGVLGMMSLGRDHAFALDERGRLDEAALTAFLRRHGGGPFLIFGFTFLVWTALVTSAAHLDLDLSNGVLVHSGGWKKMAERAVDNRRFRAVLAERTGLRRIHDFYGMAEQMGTIFLEGPDADGLRCPDFADVIVRDPADWTVCPPGEPGVIQVLSTLPRSYPGHSLLTEDLGVVHRTAGAKRFSVLGRLPATAARGCSDTLGAVA